MSVLSEHVETVMRPIVRENWRSVLSGTIRARQICGRKREFNIQGIGAINLINGMSSETLNLIYLSIIACSAISRSFGYGKEWQTSQKQTIIRCRLLEEECIL